MKFELEGLVPPVFCPFNDDGTKSLNLSVIPQYYRYLRKHGFKAALLNGSAGEAASMSVAERKLVTEAWLKVVDPDFHVMVQVGGAPLPDVLELARHAEATGARSILCLPDLYCKSKTNAELIEYLQLVEKAAPSTPLLYYHIPMFSSVSLHMGKLLEEIDGKVQNFVGIKFTSNDLDECARAFTASNGKFKVFLGSDTIMVGAAAMGITSAIAASLNVFPEHGIEIYGRASLGKYDEAREIQLELLTLIKAVTKDGHLISAMKTAMNKFSPINCGPVRPPNHTLVQQEVQELVADVEKVKRFSLL